MFSLEVFLSIAKFT